jgi:hypothetical protein
MQHFILFLCLIGFDSLLYAKEFLPKDCQALPIEDTIVLQKKKNHLVMMHSLSQYEIWLANREQNRMTASIVPGMWSVFYAPQAKSQWQCIQSEPGHEQKVPCHEVLALCDRTAKPPKKDFSKINFWVANNLSYSELNAYLQRMGWRMEVSQNKPE